MNCSATEHFTMDTPPSFRQETQEQTKKHVLALDADHWEEDANMQESRIAAQLYTVREFTQTPADIAATMKKVKQIGYAAVQVSALGPIDAIELKRILDGEGLAVCATHIPFEKMRDDSEATIEEHRLLGCRYAAIGSMPAEYRNEQGFHRFAQEASVVGARLAQGGITFAYHNHSFELQRLGAVTGLEILYSESDPCYFKAELDTYWVQHGGGDPAFWIDQLAGRIPLLHLKDMSITPDMEQLMAEVGEGNLNWPRILTSAKNAGVEWYIIEQDICQRDPFESLAISLRNLRQMGIV